MVQSGEFHSFISSTVVIKLTGQDTRENNKSQQAKLVISLTAYRERSALVLITAVIVKMFPKREQIMMIGLRIVMARAVVILS
jgi:hypothetical protein